MLGFLGRGSAFSGDNNSAFFLYENKLILIDCPMSSFLKIKEADLGEVTEIIVFVTHTHSDHINGIPLLIDYEIFVGLIPVTIVAPSAEVKEDLRIYIEQLDGCSPDWYSLNLAEEYPFIVDVVPTKHAPTLDGKCFGYVLNTDNEQIVYTGDTSTLESFMTYIVHGSSLYTEISSVKSDVHLYIEDNIDLLKNFIDNDVNVYLMHIDDEQVIKDTIKDTNIKLAPIMALEDSMSKDSDILNQIFDISDRLYSDICSNKYDTHNDIFEYLTDFGKTIVGSERASFWKWDKRHHELWTTSATGVDKITIPDNTGLVGKAIMTKQVVITNDPYNNPDFNQNVDKETGFVTKSVLVLPVADVNGNFIGAFQLVNKNNGEEYCDADVHKLSLAALVCGLALESETFLEDSHHDKLTKLKNRMGFYYDFSHKFASYISDDNDSIISMFICDIDKFKSVNDTYGHNAGDDVLAFAANLIEGCCEGNQSVYRWGGEEFIMILPDSNLSDAAQKAEEVRVKLMNSTIDAAGNTINCTMSFGCCQFNSAMTIEENISIADGHLYTAKETGRNRVVS